jgi:hypothetical protein
VESPLLTLGGSPLHSQEGAGRPPIGPAVGKSEDYRRFAHACLEIAHSTENPQTRAVMLQMAQVWLRLAEDRPSNDGEGPGD